MPRLRDAIGRGLLHDVRQAPVTTARARWAGHQWRDADVLRTFAACRRAAAAARRLRDYAGAGFSGKLRGRAEIRRVPVAVPCPPGAL